MSESWWCVFRHSPSSQDFYCVKIEYFFVCVSVLRVRDLWQSDFSCLSLECICKSVVHQTQKHY